MTSPIERRSSSTLRRNINESESKNWAQVGKGLCVWLIYKHADALINQWEALFVLLLFIILPELIKKFITMRFGGGFTGGSSYSEHTERTERTVNKGEPDNAVTR